MTTTTTSRPYLLGLLALMAIGALIAWKIATGTLAAYLARAHPEAALALAPDEAEALLNIADTLLAEYAAGGARAAAPGKAEASAGNRLGGWSEMALTALADRLEPSAPAGSSGGEGSRQPLTDDERDKIRRLAERALAADPLNARALRILGQVAEAEGDDARAKRLMQAAARSLSESTALYWMLRHSFSTNDYQQTLFYADAFLRKRPEHADLAAPMLARLIEKGDPVVTLAIDKLLAEDPPWRKVFFDNLLQSITDARTPLKLLLALNGTPVPPTVRELSGYLDFLIQRKFIELAHYTWLQFLPQHELGALALLNNGSFESTPSGLPFDWTIRAGSGVLIDIVGRQDGINERALFLELGPGRVDFPGVSQTLALAPGTYRFSGRVKGEIEGRRGPRWAIYCLGSNTGLADGPMLVGKILNWADFGFEFTVPDEGCRGQDLRLQLAARSASEELVSGSAWYDDLRLTRRGADDEPAPAATPRTRLRLIGPIVPRNPL